MEQIKTERGEHDCTKCCKPIVGFVAEVDGLLYHKGWCEPWVEPFSRDAPKEVQQ
jgi:hypothetical protein